VKAGRRCPRVREGCRYEVGAGTIDLLLRERPQCGRLHPAHERICDVRQQRELGRPGQQKPSGLSVTVDGQLDAREELGHALEIHQWWKIRHVVVDFPPPLV
jgi:hypothetical protein